jgi:hypothetical protein
MFIPSHFEYFMQTPALKADENPTCIEIAATWVQLRGT